MRNMISPTPKNDMDQFKTMLKTHSLKATPQRLAVHEAMLKLGHASADMVTDEIRKSSGTKVTVASVYNILTNMAELGIYHYRLSSNNKMYFDADTRPHQHLYDNRTHNISDLHESGLSEVIRRHIEGLEELKDFELEDIKIQLIGHYNRPKK